MQQDLAYDIRGFCKAAKLSRTKFYDLLKHNAGPRTYKVDGKRFVSCKAAEEWIAAQEAAMQETGE